MQAKTARTGQSRAAALTLLTLIMASDPGARPAAAGQPTDTAAPAQPGAPAQPAASSVPTVPPADTARWHFKVLLDGKPIGEHDFTVNRHGQDVDVHSTAHFKVKVALIPVYHYEHEEHEKWSGGCLSQIDARTNDNGKKVEVRGASSAGKFKLSSPAVGADALQDCVRTFAYWDRATLQAAARLLNSGSGEYTPARLVEQGSGQISVNNRLIAAEHVSLQTNKFAIELWYSNRGEWVALQTQTEGGRTLRYEAQ